VTNLVGQDPLTTFYTPTVQFSGVTTSREREICHNVQAVLLQITEQLIVNGTQSKIGEAARAKAEWEQNSYEPQKNRIPSPVSNRDISDPLEIAFSKYVD